MSKREMSVAGTFYPSECSEINRYISTFSADLNGKKIKARALVSPHAGYIYSGFTANMAYSRIDIKGIKRVIIIGPSHRLLFQGASIAMFDTYDSPCEEVKIDIQYCEFLLEKYSLLSFNREAHKEHSTETQVPFIKHYFPKANLVEIVYSDMDYKNLVPLVKELLEDKDNLVVISTDLSHFYDLKTANEKDSISYQSIKEMNIKGFDKGAEACGMIGVKAVLEAALSLNLQTEMIDYRTSFDASNDASSVVGYLSALIY